MPSATARKFTHRICGHGDDFPLLRSGRHLQRRLFQSVSGPRHRSGYLGKEPQFFWIGIVNGAEEPMQVLLKKGFDLSQHSLLINQPLINPLFDQGLIPFLLF